MGLISTQGGFTTTAPPEPGLFDYAHVIWRHKLLVLFVVLMVGLAAFGIDTARAKIYQGEAQLLFIPQGGAATNTSLSPADIATDMQLVNSASVQAQVAKKLGHPAPPVVVTEIGATNVAAIDVHSTSPSYAAAAANAYAKAYVLVSTRDYLASQLNSERAIQRQIASADQSAQHVANELAKTAATNPSYPQLQAQATNLYSEISTLESQLTQIQLATAAGAGSGELVTPATEDRIPISPKRKEDLILAVVVGLLLGCAIAVVRERLDDRVRDAKDLEAAAGGIPAIGLVPAVADWSDRSAPLLVSAERPRSAPSEAYRSLRASIQFMALERPLKLLQITSAAAAEGKTTTSANLAHAMAEAGQRVALIDCDLRRPRVHEFFGLDNARGLTDLIADTLDIESLVAGPHTSGNLIVVPAGSIPPNPAELLSSERAAAIFQAVAASVDVVILDSSPVLPVADSIALAARADGVLLVAAAGISTARSVTRALELLQRVNSHLVGMVLNRAPEITSYAAIGSYGYSYISPDQPTAPGGARSIVTR